MALWIFKIFNKFSKNKKKTPLILKKLTTAIIYRLKWTFFYGKEVAAIKINLLGENCLLDTILMHNEP